VRGRTAVDRPEASFDDFFRGAWSSAHRLASLVLQDAALGEEIAQEAFTQVYAAWDRIEDPQSYLRAAVVNRCRNMRRHAGVERSKLPLLAMSETAELAADELADAVAALPFRQRAVIVLRYHVGLPEAEIASILGCRPGTVKSLASRALARLSKAVEP
jgi:RNA polymerase sigma factor (sigma-70 family)